MPFTPRTRGVSERRQEQDGERSAAPARWGGWTCCMSAFFRRLASWSPQAESPHPGEPVCGPKPTAIFRIMVGHLLKLDIARPRRATTGEVRCSGEWPIADGHQVLGACPRFPPVHNAMSTPAQARSCMAQTAGQDAQDPPAAERMGTDGWRAAIARTTDPACRSSFPIVSAQPNLPILFLSSVRRHRRGAESR